MTQEKWQNILSMIKDKYKVLEHKKEPLTLKTGLNEQQKIGDKEIVVFVSPLGKIKLEYIIKPVVLDKKEYYSKRIGTSSRTQYILSQNEFIRRIEAYQETNGSWEKIDPNIF